MTVNGKKSMNNHKEKDGEDMSCSKQCFDPEDEYYEHDDCSTCPGRDDGRNSGQYDEGNQIEYLSYPDWCKKEHLPQDRTSKIVYDHWKRSIPKLQGIIDNITSGHLSRAHKDLGQYISAFRPDRFEAEQLQE